MPLGSVEALELHFDDLQSGSKNYSYTYELRNADWSSCNLSQMDYIKGFLQNRITQYRQSSIAFTRYVHYQINLPQQNSMPSRSGNYLLKVYENGDTSRLLFSKRLMVYEDKVSLTGEIQQPFTQQIFRSHQKVIVRVNVADLDIYNPAEQVKLVVLQNYNWQTAQTAAAPTFIRNKSFEYSNEDKLVFEGGKEWRWLDLRSFRLQSDRVRSIDYKANSYDVYPVPDSARSPMRYLYYRDLNGQYVIDTYENNNIWWQTDYATVHFKFLPGKTENFIKKDIYLFGEMTGYFLNEKYKLTWNEEKQWYETNLLLKNGYYNYCYLTKEINEPLVPATFRFTEGSVWDSENQYTLLFYYRPFGGRSDALVGISNLNSFTFFNHPQ